MRIVVDTGPLLAAVNRRDAAHRLAGALVASLRREAVIPTPILAETDHLLRTRVGHEAARVFLADVAAGVYSVGYLTPGLLRRAVELDARYAGLNLGLADTSVMAFAERHRLAILTFDFTDFRATGPKRGSWRLVVDERTYAAATER